MQPPTPLVTTIPSYYHKTCAMLCWPLRTLRSSHRVPGTNAGGKNMTHQHHPAATNCDTTSSNNHPAAAHALPVPLHHSRATMGTSHPATQPPSHPDAPHGAARCTHPARATTEHTRAAAVPAAAGMCSPQANAACLPLRVPMYRRRSGAASPRALPCLPAAGRRSREEARRGAGSHRASHTCAVLPHSSRLLATP
jgi:hypothetical protein